MKKTLSLILAFFFVTIIPNYASASLFSNHGSGQSYAQEYNSLRQLLEKVTNTESAIKYKQAIEDQIEILNKNQHSGAENFNAMSKEEKKFFIKKFQNNRFHCGEVTQVMTEKQRILLDKNLHEILGETLSKIP